MKVREILNKKITALPTVDGWHNYHQGWYDYTQVNITLYDFLFVLGKRYKEAIDLYRQIPYHSKEQSLYKNEFPTAFIGGTFPMQQTEDKDIITYTDVIAIDIDKKDNTHINLEEKIKDIYKLPYVIGTPFSISGEGYYVLILVENGKYTKGYYKYLVKLFKSKYNINIDDKCKNIGRKRFISYQDNLNEVIKSLDIDIISFKLLENETDCLFDNNTMNRMIDYNPKQFNKQDNILFAKRAIWKLLDSGYSVDDVNTNNNQYSVWYHIGCEFRSFDDGYDMFVKFSNNSSKYNDDINTINKKWNNTKNNKNIDDVCRKWCGIAKNKFGNSWWKL